MQRATWLVLVVLVGCSGGGSGGAGDAGADAPWCDAIPNPEDGCDLCMAASCCEELKLPVNPQVPPPYPYQVCMEEKCASACAAP